MLSINLSNLLVNQSLHSPHTHWVCSEFIPKSTCIQFVTNSISIIVIIIIYKSHTQISYDSIFTDMSRWVSNSQDFSIKYIFILRKIFLLASSQRYEDTIRSTGLVFYPWLSALLRSCVCKYKIRYIGFSLFLKLLLAALTC